MSEQKITVRIDSSRPVFIEADPDEFGSIFAHLNDHDQIEVLRSMVKHMKPHRSQWDYIAIALEKDENRDVFNDLSVLFPETEILVGQIDELRVKNAHLLRVIEAAKPYVDREVSAAQKRGAVTMADILVPEMIKGLSLSPSSPLAE